MVQPLKPWMSIDDQIGQLRRRRMEISDQDRVRHALSTIGYYRLSGYWHVYRRPDPDNPDTLQDDFHAGTSFDDVLALYEFDRSLRDHMWSAVELIEVAFRSRIGHILGRPGPVAHTDPMSFRPGFDHQRWWRTASRRIERARGRDATVDHHFERYGGRIPLWVLTDLLDFSDVSKLYAGMRSRDQREIAEWFGVTMAPDVTRTGRKSWNKNPPLANWLENLTLVRNICAHHGRLWNRQLIPLGVSHRVQHLEAFSEFIDSATDVRPSEWQIERVYGTICISTHLMKRIEPAESWRADVDTLIRKRFPAGRHLTEMGFPPVRD